MTAPETQNAMNICKGKTAASKHARISVAMATYNGEKYIEEQLLSICRQTRKPDEIVVSDDGSKDATLEIVERVSRSEDATGIEFVIITDNPRHGYCGNFEWAIQHTTGDLVFLSDQDDVWMPEKVAEVINVFSKYPDASCVFHNASLIGKNGEPIEGVFDERLTTGELNLPQGQIKKLDRDNYLAPAISWGGIRGMSMCITCAFADSVIPFPPNINGHDKWIMVCAIVNDAMYYVNLPLTRYRLHGNNICGNATYRGNLWNRVEKILHKFKSHRGSSGMYYYTGMATVQRLSEAGLSDHSANVIANRLVEIGEKIHDAESSGRLMGAFKLCRLFCSDMRYRHSGTGAFVQDLVYILRTSKKKRQKNMDGEFN